MEDNIVGRVFQSTATKKVNNDGFFVYTNFAIDKKFAHAFGKKSEDVINVELTVLEQDINIREYYKTHDENTPDYFAFYDIEGDRIRFAFCNVKVYNCCFAYGADVACFDCNGKQAYSNLIIDVKEIN